MRGFLGASTAGAWGLLAHESLNPSPSEIFNAEVLFREDCSPDEFIDVIVGNRVYMPCLYVSGRCGAVGPLPDLLAACFPQLPPPPFPSQVYNKIDQISMEEVDRLARKPNSVVIR